jgi:NADH-quinone oxidoreductase subunit N
MNAIIVLAIAGIISMYLGLFNLKRLGLPVAILAVLTALVLTLFSGIGGESSWLSPELYQTMFSFTDVSRSYSTVMLLVTLLIFIASYFYYDENIEHLSDIYALFLFSLIGALIIVSYQSLVMLFVGIEILSIPLYILASSNRRNVNANEAGLKYYLLGSFASCFLLLGITLMYGVTGSFDVSKISAFLSANGVNAIYLLGLISILGAFVFKIAAVPLHFWAPDVYQGSPTTMTSYLATVAKIATFGGLIRLMDVSYAQIGTDIWYPLLMIVAISTLIIGSLLTLHQTNLKRLLAYTGIANVGFILIAFVAWNAESQKHILYYFLGYSIATVAVFSIYSTVKNKTNIDSIPDLRGLLVNNRLITLTLIVMMLSFTGIPPLAGFFGKFFLIVDGLRGGEVVLVVIAMITSVISAYNYISLLTHTIQTEGTVVPRIEISPLYRLYLIASIIAIILIGLFPDAILSVLGR